MQHPDRVTITRRIAAPARRIFEILTDPQRHVDIDSSGMLLAAPNATLLRAVGDTFEIDMDREPLGDLPLGKYKVVNTVTTGIQDVEVAWTVVAPGKRSVGHVWGYRLEPVNDNETDVTNYYDWSAVSQEWRERFHWPVVPPAMFEQTLVNLERIATEPN